MSAKRFENSACGADNDEQTNSGWLIERADSPASRPKYWAGSSLYAEVSDPRRSSSWTENHDQAIRFARRLDAQRVSERFMRGILVRICQHIWRNPS